MKVLLLNPSLKQSKVGHYKESVEKRRGIFPTLGLCYIAGMLRREGCEVKLFDLDAMPMDEAGALRAAREFAPDWVGVYIMTWTFHAAADAVKRFREVLPSAVFVAGGPQVASFPAETLECSDYDFAVRGEGEGSIPELLRLLSKEIDPSQVPGLVYRDADGIRSNPCPALIDPLDSIPYPARDLLEGNRYFDVFARHRSFMTMITSRGCPYNCLYCDRENRMGRKWRGHSARRVVDEIEEGVKRYGVREVMFFDDEFIINQNRVFAICDDLQSRGLKVDWECRARVDQIDEKLLSSMRRAGCYRIRFGFESGNDNILRALKKDITVSQSIECARIARKSGMEIFGYFMLGCPGETPETAQQTIDLALKLDLDFAIFSKAILIPGSEMFEWGVTNGYVRADHWQRYLRGRETNTNPAIDSKELPEKDVDRLVDAANRAFYTRPAFFMKRLARIRSAAQLLHQARMGFALLFS